jgi:hypothetical protein
LLNNRANLEEISDDVKKKNKSKYGSNGIFEQWPKPIDHCTWVYGIEIFSMIGLFSRL